MVSCISGAIDEQREVGVHLNAVLNLLIEMARQQQPPDWDPVYIWREPSASFKLYLLFLLIVGVMCCVKLLRIWWLAPPFKLSRQSKNTSYLRLLQITSRSIAQWIGLTFLGWGIYMSANLKNVCERLLAQKVVGSANMVFVLYDYAALLTVTLSTLLFLFVARWHVLRRIDFLDNQ